MPSEGNKVMSDEEAAQRAAADSLQRQIDSIIQGQRSAQPSATPSLRDFVNDKMAEDAAEGEQKK